MKNKGKIWVGLGIILAVIALVAGILLNSGTSIQEAKVDLPGTWLIYSYAGEPVMTQEIEFTEDNAKLTDTDTGNVQIDTGYEYKDGAIIIDDGTKINIKVLSDDHIILVTDNQMERRLLKVADGTDPLEEVTMEALAGEYNVNQVAGEPRANEIMKFEGSHLTDTREGSEYLQGDLKLTTKGMRYPELEVEGINLKYYTIKKGDKLFFIEQPNMYVWELKAVD